MVAEQGRLFAVAEGQRMGGVQLGREDGAADALRAPRGRHLLVRQVGRVGRTGLESFVDQFLADEPAGGALPRDERAAFAHPPLEPVHVFRAQIVIAHGHDQGRVAVQVQVRKTVGVHQGDRDAEPLVEQVPGLADLVGPGAGTRKQRDLRLDQHGRVRAAQVAARRREPRVRAVDDHVVLRDDAVDQGVDLFGRHRGRRVALGDGDDDRAPVEGPFRAACAACAAGAARAAHFARAACAAGAARAAHFARAARSHREGLAGHPGPDARVQDAVERAGGVVPVPFHQVGVGRASANQPAAVEIGRRDLRAGQVAGVPPQFTALDAHGQGQGPGRHVVEEGVLEGRNPLHGRLDQPRLGLVQGDDDRLAGPERTFAGCPAAPGAVVPTGLPGLRGRFGPHGPREFVYTDAVAEQHLQEGLGARARFAQVEDVGLDGVLPGRFGRRGVEIALVGQQLGPQGQAAGQGRHGSGDLVADGVGVGQHPVVGHAFKRPGRGLLEEDADGAVHVRERGPLPIEEVVEGLPRIVQRAVAVEPLGVVFGQRRRKLEGPFRGVRVVPARDPGLEEIGRVAAHLVDVGQHLGAPVVEQRNPAPRFGMLRHEPVPVEVEPVVVGPPARPRRHVLPVLPVPRGDPAPVGVDPVDETVPAVRVVVGVHDNHGAVQQAVHGRSAARGEVVEHQHGRLGTARLVAVHAVAHVDDDGHGLDHGVGDLARRVGQPVVGQPDFLQAPVVGRRRDHGVVQAPPLVGGAVAVHHYAVRDRGHGPEIVGHQVGPRVRRAHRVPDDRFGTGDGRVVGCDARHADFHDEGQVLRPGGAGDEQANQAGDK